MNSQQLQYFLVVSEQKSLSKAAERLYISQPALTQSIAKLEHEIGIPLFRREHSGVVLTDAGTTVVNSARNLLYFEAQMRTRIANLHAPSRREFSIVVQRPYLSSIESLLQMIRQCKYPEMAVNITGISARSVEDALASGSADLAIYSTLLLPSEPVVYRILNVQTSEPNKDFCIAAWRGERPPSEEILYMLDILSLQLP